VVGGGGGRGGFDPCARPVGMLSRSVFESIPAAQQGSGGGFCKVALGRRRMGRKDTLLQDDEKRESSGLGRGSFVLDLSEDAVFTSARSLLFVCRMIGSFEIWPSRPEMSKFTEYRVTGS
jgi:hypothetical protein